MALKSLDSIAVTADKLCKHYGSAVGLQDMSLSVRHGEIFGFVGPNGAGKTTTIRLLLGLIRPTDGTFSLLGKNPRRDRSILKDVGYLPGDLGLYGNLTAIEYFEHFLRLRGVGRSAATVPRLQELMERFPMDFKRPIRTYSKGMRQLTGLIQAFMHQPKVVLLDEPASGLDPLMQERFYDLLAEERKRGCTFFFSSHILNEVDRVCDRVALIREGRLVAVHDMIDFRARIGKKIHCTTNGVSGALFTRLTDLPGVHALHQSETSISCFYTGDMETLLQVMSSFRITDFTCQSPSIQEYFLRMCQEEKHG